MRFRVSLPLLVAALALQSTSLSATDAGRLAGRWEGAILVRPASVEIPLILEVPEGAVDISTARISFPTQGVVAGKLDKIAADGAAIEFVYKDAHDTSQFRAQLQPDGRTLEGTLTEGTNVFPFSAEKQRGAPTVEERPLQALGAGSKELREQFEKDQGKVRILLILSPTCGTCRESARIVQKYVLDTLGDPNLKVYVVWEPVQKGDSQEMAAKATSYLPDPRATHYWAADRSTGTAFKPALGIQSFPAWDVFLVFGPAAHWTSAPPEPVAFMHNLLGEKELPIEKRLDGVKLAETVQGQLAAKP